MPAVRILKKLFRRFFHIFHADFFIQKVQGFKNGILLKIQLLIIFRCIAGYTPENYQKLDFEQDSVFESLYFLNKKISVENMKKAAEELFQNPDCGHIFRIKGFLNTNYKEEVMMENKMEDEMEKVDKPRITKAESWKEFNATRKNISIQPVKEGQEVLIMIGAGLKQEKIEECLERHCTEGFEK